jgi:hypothetical protein
MLLGMSLICNKLTIKKRKEHGINKSTQAAEINENVARLIFIPLNEK